MYEMWKEDPNSVHASWRAYFSGVDGEVEEPYQPPPSLGKTTGAAAPAHLEAIIAALKKSGFMQGAAGATGEDVDGVYSDSMKMMALIRGYMAYGHL